MSFTFHHLIKRIGEYIKDREYTSERFYDDAGNSS